MTVPVVPIRSDAAIEDVRKLLRTYVDDAGVDLTSQDIENEIAALPGRYVPPRGELLMAIGRDGEPIGCVATHAIGKASDAEVKRLFVHPDMRGLSIGRTLFDNAMEAARKRGYRRIVLDTMPDMTAAIATYRSMGFEEIPAYWDNALPAMYFAKNL